MSLPVGTASRRPKAATRLRSCLPPTGAASKESALGSLLVEITILHAAMRKNATQVLRDAATASNVDVDAIGLKVKNEFAAKENAQAANPAPATI